MSPGARLGEGLPQAGADRVVRIPHDPPLRYNGFQGLGRLRPATTRVFLQLADLVVGNGTR